MNDKNLPSSNDKPLDNSLDINHQITVAPEVATLLTSIQNEKTKQEFLRYLTKEQNSFEKIKIKEIDAQIEANKTERYTHISGQIISGLVSIGFFILILVALSTKSDHTTYLIWAMLIFISIVIGGKPVINLILSKLDKP